MKKILTTAFIVFSAIAYSFAQQTVPSDFYLMKSEQDAEYVLKAINIELRLAEPEFTKVKELLFTSAKSQQEQFRLSPDAERVDIIKARQTAHIENNLKAIVGEEKYNFYLKTKDSIYATLKEFRRN